MKKLIYALVMTTLVIGFAGCGNTNSNNDDIPSPNISDNNDISNINVLYSERDKNKELENLISEAFEIPDDAKNETKYYYNHVDLNNDGSDEILALVIGPYTTGSGGSSLLIAETKNDILVTKQSLNLINPPIIIADTQSGMKDIIIKDRESESYIKLKYVDGEYISVSDGEKIEGLKDINGVQIISDDLALDLENDNYLTLE